MSEQDSIRLAGVFKDFSGKVAQLATVKIVADLIVNLAIKLLFK